MQILALRFNDGSVRVTEAPAPVLGAGFVRVRTLFSAVSPGTEGNKIVTGRKSLVGKAKARPDQVRQVVEMARSMGIRETMQKVRAKLDGAQPLGYSLSGVVLEVGEGVSHVKVGDLVACGGGGYANHADEVVVPRNLVARIPDGVDPDAAALATLGAIAMQGIRIAAPTLGESVVVTGLGIIGLLAGQLLRANGCRVFGLDVDPGALEFARQHQCIDAGAEAGNEAVQGMVADFTRGRGADAVIICAATPSNEPVHQAGQMVRQRGRVVVVGAVGMDVPRPDYYEKEIEFRVSCSYGPGRYDPTYEEQGVDYPAGFVRWTEGRNIEAFLDLVAGHRLRPAELVTHRFPFAEGPRAYDLLSSRAEPFAGILLEYPAQTDAGPATIVLDDRAVPATALGIGCIGAGSYAQSFLLPPLREAKEATFTSIFTRTGLSARDVGERLGFQRAVGSASEVLEDPQTSAVVIATRHDQHGPLVKDALAMGKHVFVEKPLCLNREELDAIVATSTELQAADRMPVLQTGFNRRFSPAAGLLRRHFGQDHGPLVMVYRVNAGAIPRTHWVHDPVEGGGRIIGEVCHFIDLMQYIAGADPVSVQAQCIEAAGPDIIAEDHVLITLRFGDGSVGTVAYVAGGAKSLPKEHLEVHGDGRSAILDNFTSVTLSDDRHQRRKRCPGKGQREEVLAFLSALSEGRQPIPLASQFATTLATFEAVASLRAGGEARLIDRQFRPETR